MLLDGAIIIKKAICAIEYTKNGLTQTAEQQTSQITKKQHYIKLHTKAMAYSYEVSAMLVTVEEPIQTRYQQVPKSAFLLSSLPTSNILVSSRGMRIKLPNCCSFHLSNSCLCSSIPCTGKSGPLPVMICGSGSSTQQHHICFP